VLAGGYISGDDMATALSIFKQMSAFSNTYELYRFLYNTAQHEKFKKIDLHIHTKIIHQSFSGKRTRYFILTRVPQPQLFLNRNL
jgi:hypothetical protein